MRRNVLPVYWQSSNKKACVIGLFFWTSFLRVLESIEKDFKMCPLNIQANCVIVRQNRF